MSLQTRETVSRLAFKKGLRESPLWNLCLTKFYTQTPPSTSLPLEHQGRPVTQHSLWSCCPHRHRATWSFGAPWWLQRAACRFGRLHTTPGILLYKAAAFWDSNRWCSFSAHWTGMWLEDDFWIWSQTAKPTWKISRSSSSCPRHSTHWPSGNLTARRRLEDLWKWFRSSLEVDLDFI